MSEVVALNGAGKNAPVAKRRRLDSLSEVQLKKKLKRRFWGSSAISTLGLVPLFASVFSVANGASQADSYGWLGLGTGLVLSGVISLARTESIHEALGRAEERSALERRKVWQLELGGELKDSLGISFSPEELDGLNYPDEIPTSSSTIRYGTIEKLIPSDGDTGDSLRKVTLVWDGTRFKFLSEISKLQELNREVLA